MANLSQRHTGYKIGLAVFLLALILYITGFATPNWADYTFKAGEPGSTTKDFVLEGHAGLWKTCITGFFGESHCADNTHSDGWILGVKIAQCLGVVILVLSLLHAAYINLLSRSPSVSRLLEIGLALAGGLGLGGAITYAVKVEEDERYVDNQEGNHDYDSSVSWSFGINIAGSGLLLLACFLVSIFNRPLPPTPPQTQFQPAVNFTTVAMPMGAVPVQQGHQQVHVLATSGNMAAYAPAVYSNAVPAPPAYYSNSLVQGSEQGQGQGQAAAFYSSPSSSAPPPPQVFDTPVPQGTKM